jgi:hypothetical protein
MAISLDFWRTVQRLRTDAERRDRALARAARDSARRRARRQPQGSSWRLVALYGLPFATPVVAALGFSPQALRSNAEFLLDAVARCVG